MSQDELQSSDQSLNGRTKVASQKRNEGELETDETICKEEMRL